MGQADSKLAFRNAIVRLVDEQDIQDKSFWTGLFELPESVQDVFSFISSADIRKFLTKNPAHARALINKSADILLAAILDLPLPLSAEDGKMVLNAMRIITRMLPYVFEMADPAFEQDLFWTKEAGASDTPDEDENAPLADRLMVAATSLLFLPGFTLSPDCVDADFEKRIRYIIWKEGVGSSSAPSSTAQLDANRTEATRFLLTLLSLSMYQEPRQMGNRYLHLFVTKLEKPAILALICSFLNTVVQYNPVGWVPYGHALFSDSQEHLVQICAQLLNVLLNYTEGLRDLIDSLSPRSARSSKSPISPIDLSQARQSISSIDMKRQPSIDDMDGHVTNLFRHYTARLHRPADLELILNGVNTLLKNPVQASQTYLPSSMKEFSFPEEVVMLFWTLLEINDNFFSFVCSSEKTLDVVTALVYQCLAVKLDPSKIGLLRMASFTLHVLSAERSFAVLLNQKMNETLPSHIGLPAFSGNHADLLLISICHLIGSTKGRLASLYECFLTVLSNISPYIKSFCVVSANKLLMLFNSFTNPVFLLANESNHVLIFYLLDVFNNIIQYQFDGNPHLVYELLRHQKTFAMLNFLTLSQLLELRAQALEKRKEASLSNDNASAVDKGKEPAYDLVQFNEEWFDTWHSQLPLKAIDAMLEALTPQVQKLQDDQGLVDENTVIQHLQSGTLVGVLPVPHPLFVRKFNYNDGVRVWFKGYMWGVIYLRHVQPQPSLFIGTNVKLFAVITSSDESVEQ